MREPDIPVDTIEIKGLDFGTGFAILGKGYSVVKCSTINFLCYVFLRCSMHVCTDAINSMMINAFYTLEIRGADVPMRINKFQPCLSVSGIGAYFIVMCESQVERVGGIM